MAEAFAVLGAVASIIQLVQFSSKLVAYTHELVTSGNDALRETTETERLTREYERLSQIVQDAHTEHESVVLKPPPAEKQVRSRAERRLENGPFDPSKYDEHELAQIVYTKERRRRDEDKNILNLAGQCQQEAQALLTLLSELRMTAASAGWKRLKEGSAIAAKYLRKKRDIERRRKRLKELHGLLSTAMAQAESTRRLDRVPRLLMSLQFDGMQCRQDTVADAYQGTYTWALNDDESGLKPWLESGNGVFWITGKPGAGKSTLMKYLYSKDGFNLLQKWCGSSRLVAASFYFWYLGSIMQKSIEGLLRTLLYQMLIELPELACIACPEFFALSDNRLEQFQWTPSSLTASFNLLISRTAQDDYRSDTKLCIFIDGLDEYAGDHLGLVQLLFNLDQAHGIKMCVSSRPWTVFSQAFERKVPHLQLQDYTRADIMHFARDKIQTSRSRVGTLCPFSDDDDDSEYERDEEDSESLIREICARAEGVFLWVHLVVLEVTRGLAERDPVAMLRRRVQAFPPDLEKFFRELIYDRVDRVYARQTNQALLLAFMYVEQSNTLLKDPSFLDYWLIQQDPDGLQDPEFAYKLEYQIIPHERLKKMAKATKRFLSSACRDLLIFEKAANLGVSTKVTFLHRTVYDFLRTAQMHEVLLAEAPRFFVSKWIFHLLALSRLKMLHQNSETGISSTPVTSLFNTALSTHHPEMTEQYVADFTSAVQRSEITEALAVRVSAVQTLIAFRQNDAAFLNLEADATSYPWSCLSAALGESPLHEFDIEDISLSLFRRLLGKRYYTSPPELTGEPHRCIDAYSRPELLSTCSSSEWQGFLRKWHIANSTRRGCHDDRERKKMNKKGCEVAALFLKAGAPLGQAFCSRQSPRCNEGEHEWRTAVELLQEHFTRDFLEDFQHPVQLRFG